MPAREVIDAWETIIDECAELYDQVRATVTDLPEIKTDLSGTSAKGAPPPLPGGDKLAATGPFSLDAPHDDFPHPLRVAYKWSWHCAEVNAAIPPRRAWEPCIAYLRAHLHLIDGEHVPEFHAELQRTRGNLRRLCNMDRLSQAESVADRHLRGEEAQVDLRRRLANGDIPEWLPPGNLRRYRTLVTVDRQEAEILFPQLARPREDEFSEYDPGDVDAAWNRIRVRSNYWRERGEPIPQGRYMVAHLKKEADMLKPW